MLERTDEEGSTEQGEETEKEWYPHITLMKMKDKLRKRTVVDDDDFEEDDMPLTKTDSVIFSTSKPSLIHVLTSAVVRIWHSQILTLPPPSAQT